MVNPVIYNGVSIQRHISKGVDGVPYIRYNNRKYIVEYVETRPIYNYSKTRIVKTQDVYRTIREI